MFNKINKRTIILICIISVFIIGISILKFKEMNKTNNSIDSKQDYEQYLDNGLEFSTLLDEKKFLNDIEITPIKNGIIFNFI